MIKSKQKQKTELNQILKINQAYSQLLAKLANNKFVENIPSRQAYLFDTYSILQSLQKQMNQELAIYKSKNNPLFSQFIKDRKLLNANNLIGKWEEIKQSVSQIEQSLIQTRNDLQKNTQLQNLSNEEIRLEKQLQYYVQERIKLQNKNQIIKYQIDCCQKDLTKSKNQNLKNQMTLRQREKQT